jgi:hypothetical protein
MRIVCVALVLLGTMHLEAQSTAIAIFGSSTRPTAAQAAIPRFVTIPHIAVGGGWNTEFSAVNCSNTSQQVQIVFFTDGLTALQIPLSGLKSGMAMANGALVSLQPMGAFTFQTNADATSPVINGFAVISTSDDPIAINENVQVFAVYRQHADTRQDASEATVQQFRPVERIVFPFDNSNGYFTGIGLSGNPYSLANVLIRDENGATLWSGNLPPAFRFHWAFLLRDEFPITNGIRGTVQFSALAPPGLSAIALRFSRAGTFTSLTPVYQGSASGFPYTYN